VADRSGPLMADLRVPDEDLKMLRENLCRAQHLIGAIGSDKDRGVLKAMERIGHLINEIDRHRPLGPDCKHKDRHTPTCGCEDKPLCVHCGEGVRRTEQGDWVHYSGLYRCQSNDVPYGHLAHPPNYPCRGDGPNPCLGYGTVKCSRCRGLGCEQCNHVGEWKP
jgi:hypothetical protein